MPSVNPLNWWSGTPGPKMAELSEVKAPIPVRLLWQANVGASDGAIFTPALGADEVYVAEKAGAVVRLDLATGKPAWRVSTGRSLSGGVGAEGNTVAVGTSEGEVIALEAGTGAVRWRARVSSEVLAAPVISSDIVIVRSADNRLFGLDARDGKRRWVYQRAAQALAVRTPAGLVVSRGNAYAGFPGGKLVAVALSNGGLRWEGTVATPRGSTELERVADVIGMPWVSDREVCAVAYQGRIACFDIANGNSHWSREMSSVSGLGSDGRFLYVSDDKGAVHALDRVNGTSLWKQDKLLNRNLSAPLALASAVAVGDVTGYVHLVSRETGEFVARVATDGSAISASPVATSSGFIVQTRKGGVFAFSLK